MMVKGICPVCDELVTITPVGKKKREGYSAEYWRVLEHWHETQPCTGSGRLI